MLSELHARDFERLFSILAEGTSLNSIPSWLVFEKLFRELGIHISIHFQDKRDDESVYYIQEMFSTVTYDDLRVVFEGSLNVSE